MGLPSLPKQVPVHCRSRLDRLSTISPSSLPLYSKTSSKPKQITLFLFYHLEASSSLVCLLSRALFLTTFPSIWTPLATAVLLLLRTLLRAHSTMSISLPEASTSKTAVELLQFHLLSSICWCSLMLLSALTSLCTFKEHKCRYQAIC